MSDNDDAIVQEKNVKIFVRILPLETFCESCAKIDFERKRIYVRCLQEMQPNRIVVPKKPSYWCFQADGIFCDSTQEEVYRVSAKDLPFKVLNGVSCVLMGYGQTCSGKSFTINGLRNNWEHRGLVARLLSQMFAEKSNRKKVSDIEYRVSFVELYGKEARDLLASDADNRVRINEREPFKHISVLCMDDAEDGLKMIFQGEVRRSIVNSCTYSASHLATAVITFHVSDTSLITSWGVVTTAKLHIVEAAGTGSVGRDNGWKTATDIGTANLMKTQLEQFFSYVTSPRSSAINVIRSSNLLKILGSAFSVSSVIRLISHIRITKEDLDMTLSTLRFTSRIARLKPVKIREDVQYRADFIVTKLRNEVNSLKKELTLNDLFLRQEALENISQSRFEQINRSILNFLGGNVSDFTLFNACQAQVLLKVVKDLYNRLTVKELEVEKLRETYDLLAKTISDSPPSTPTSLPKEVVPSHTDAQIDHWQRLRSLSQILLDVQVKKETEREEVGHIDKSKAGVTLGPYTEDMLPHRPITEPEILKIDDQNMAAARQMFNSFLKEEGTYARVKDAFIKNERALRQVRQTFSNTIDDYFQTKRKLDDACDKLRKHRQLHRVLKHDVGEIIPEVEKEIACHKKVLSNLEEEMHEMQFEINELSVRHTEMSTKLESAFREYCKKKNLLLHYTDKSMRTLLESFKEESTEMLRNKYNKFQRAMLRKIEETRRPKKARIESKRGCNSGRL